MISINRQLMSAGGQFPWRQLRRECISFNAAVKLLGFRLTRMSRGSAINCLTRPETAWWLVLASLEEMTTTNIQPAARPTATVGTQTWQREAPSEDVISFDTALTSVSAAKRWKCGVPPLLIIDVLISCLLLLGGSKWGRAYNLYNFTELMQVQLWRRLGSATVEADVMLHSGFMSRAGDSVLIMGYDFPIFPCFPQGTH